ncbi:TIGR02300 family protein [Sphingomonas morindae]|uniref:TIGR02300 family protein n=1 Tax=Sphingomonas morindae TaxID=1541170 RepID=A0ABY4X5Z1_9SPHN|nr:TIGR02300 family protein [Sphingomonas morindae]USI72329.1 TIGR02300 family protein [Sphingomonas morindae]
MVKPEWGTKRTCPKCGTRFYDLGKDDPATCINCGVSWAPEPVLKSKQPLPFDAPKPVEKVADTEADADLAEDLDIEEEDGEPVDDDTDLGGDDDLGVAKHEEDDEQ